MSSRKDMAGKLSAMWISWFYGTICLMEGVVEWNGRKVRWTGR